MGVKVTNNAFGTLSAGINTTDTTITLDSGQGARFPTLGAGDYFYGTIVDTSNNIEIVKVTARSTDSMTVTRAQDNTTATAFAIGDRFELRPTAALFEDIIDSASVDGITSNSTSGTAMTISSSNDVEFSNNVGIGTTPEAKLHISTGGGIVPFASSQVVSESAGNNYIELNGGSASTTALYFGDSADQDAGGVLYNHSNDSMSLRVNALSRMTIDSSGRVTMPYQPACHIRQAVKAAVNASSGVDLANGYWLTPSGTYFDNGNNFSTSTGRFTAPVSGYYHFNHSLRVDSFSGSYVYISVFELFW